MKAVLAGLVMALLAVGVVRATAPSISVDQTGPYHWGDTITLTVEVSKLKGYEYPVVIGRCDFASGSNFWYWRRWDTEGPLYPWGSGSEPILLNSGTEPPASVDCTFELWAYGGASHPASAHILASAAIHIDP